MAILTAGNTAAATVDLLDLTAPATNDIIGIVVHCKAACTIEIPGLHISGEAMPLVAGQTYSFRNEFGLTQMIIGGAGNVDFAISERIREQPRSMRGRY